MKKNKKIDIILYNGYEIFLDPCYYDMFAVRKQGSTKFEEAIHVNTKEEAYFYINKNTIYN